jgi:hypothetical protein
MFSYRALLKQAWGITRKNKHLWLFGLFASLTAAGGSWEYQALAKNLNKSLLSGDYLPVNGLVVFAELLKNMGRGLIDMFSYDFWVGLNVVSLLIIILVFTGLFVWLAIASQSALIDSVKKLSNPKTAKKATEASIRATLTDGHRHFWPVFGLNLLIKVSLSFISFLITLPLLFLVFINSSGLAASYVILFIILVPIGTGLALMIKYAICYKVLDNCSFVSSIEKGWKIFKKYWLISLETAIILFVITLGAGLALLLLLTIVITPILAAGIIFQAVWIIILALLLAFAVIVFAGAILTTFQVSAWTGLFLQLKEGVGLAKLERVFRK